MNDRVIDVSSSNTGIRTDVVYTYPGMVGGTPTTISLTSNSQTRKRVPTGGPEIPHVEKPFTNTSVKFRYPFGDIITSTRSSSYTVRSGDHGTSSYNMGSGVPTLHCTLHYPMGDAASNTAALTATQIKLNPDLLSQAEVKALNKLRDKSGTNAPDFGMFYAERRETARMFRDAVVGTLNLARSIANRDYARSVQVLKDAFGVAATPAQERRRVERVTRWLKRQRIKDPALRGLELSKDAWLTYKLGLSPLMKDLANAHLRLQTGDLTTTLAVKAVARHSRQVKGQEPKRWSTPVGEVTALTTCDDLHGYTVTLVAYPAFTEQARLSRLGLANPAALAYNATSLTFAIDYFLALGPFLKAINIPMEFEWKEGSWTHRARRTTTLEIRSPMGKVAKGEYELNHTQRKLYTSFPVPIPPLSLKGKDLHADKHVTLAALALNGLQKLFQPHRP